MGKIINFIMYLCIVLFSITIIVKMYNSNDNLIKNQIIKNSDQIKKVSDDGFKIDPYDDWYFTDITIKMISDSSYYVIMWGDRDSEWWWLLSDVNFYVDIPYNEYRKINVSKDKEILKILYEKR